VNGIFSPLSSTVSSTDVGTEKSFWLLNLFEQKATFKVNKKDSMISIDTKALVDLN